MKAKKRIVTICLLIALLAIALVSGSLAYFTDTSDTETNVFTVGKVDISLEESDWDPTKEDDHKLIPGRVIAKNPTVTVESDSEDAYVFLKVEFTDDFVSLLSNYAEATIEHEEGTTVDLANTDVFEAVIGNWFKFPEGAAPDIMAIGDGSSYMILGVSDFKTAEDEVVFFEAITVPDSVDSDMFEIEAAEDTDNAANADAAEGAEAEGPKYELNVTAYAIQEENIDDCAAAFAVLFPNDTLITD